MRKSSVLTASVAFALSAIVAGCSSGSSPTSPTPAATARYVVSFDSTWSGGSHPTDFPADAHYSGLIGGTHAAGVTFWREGQLASQGIRDMAERGRKSPLDSEVMQAIASDGAEFLLSGPTLDVTPGSASLEFDITDRFPLVTLVTMVAPSPDWFVGVSGLSLRQNGAWVSELRVDLYPYDAGTDSGPTYRAPDEETIPRQPISKLTGYPVASAGAVARFGTFTFRRIR